MSEVAQQQIAALEKKVRSDARSPLFAQLANYYLDADRAEDALRLCDAGIANFPFYTTGHLVKGKALAALHMRAEARREFEFVLGFLPRNESVAALLEQIPPGEEETLAPAPQAAKPQVTEPTYTPPVRDEYSIQSKLQQRPETEYGFGGFDQPIQEPTTEPTPAPTSLSGPSFFEAITQAPTVPPVVSPEEDAFGFGGPTVEAPAIPEPSSFGGFEAAPPETPAYTEKEDTTFADVPREVVEPTSDFEVAYPVPDLTGVAPVPSEEESFEKYASRRRAELSGEDSMTLEEYLESPELSLPQEQPPEAPIAINIPEKIQETVTPEEPVPELSISLPQMQLPDMVDVVPQVQHTEPDIVLPQAQPPDLPLSSDIQNQIEEIANKLQGAKITPVIDMTQKETPPASEQDLPVSMGFVTPTLAEIYAKQGWYDDAIKAYKALARNKPAERERFEKRIEELETLKSKSSK